MYFGSDFNISLFSVLVLKLHELTIITERGNLIDDGSAELLSGDCVHYYNSFEPDT